MPDNGDHPFRVPVTVSLIVTFIGAGITWGVFSNRVISLEVRAEKLESLALIHDREIVESRAQYTEIIRRLNSIDGKIDQREWRRQ